MEGMSQAVWNFMESAHRKGLLDELVALNGVLLDPKNDFDDVMGNFEDALCEADFTPFEEMSKETLGPVLKALTDDKVLDALYVLVSTIRPVLQNVVQMTGGDPRVLAAAADSMKMILGAFKPIVTALLPVIAEKSAPAMERFLKEDAGSLAALGINTACAAVNSNPEIASRFISDLYAGVDGASFRKAMDTLTEGFLDQRPPLAVWTVATAVNQAKKRLPILKILGK